EEADESALLGTALDGAGERWAATAPPAEDPGPGRPARPRPRSPQVGAAQPSAVEEYATVRARLEDLERQHDDLRAAIGRTRGLIAELDTLISEQFRTTFRALETSFAARCPPPRCPSCSRCSRSGRCPSASSTRSTRPSTRRTSAGSRRRSASSPRRR